MSQWHNVRVTNYFKGGLSVRAKEWAHDSSRFPYRWKTEIVLSKPTLSSDVYFYFFWVCVDLCG